MDREDLKRVAPQWLQITEDVRADPEVWRKCGHAGSVGVICGVDDGDRVTTAPTPAVPLIINAVQAWRFSGDGVSVKGDRPWISEMYGYVYAAANNSLWHTWDKTVMKYPTYTTMGEPR